MRDAIIAHAAPAAQLRPPLQGALKARLNPAGAMFLEAFGLRRDPFLDTADPSLYYDTLAAAHSRRRLVECLAAGRGLAVVVGAIGAGKTTLFAAATSQLAADARNLVGMLLDPVFCDERELLLAIADCFGFEVDPAASLRDIKEALKRSLFDARSQQAILLVDEAQLLPEPMLETLRALLNYQLDDRKLLAVALAGQLELGAAVLRRPNLADRVALWIELGPLRESDATGLVEHRLRQAGYAAARSPFAEDALRALWAASGGLPRRLVVLAREAMEVAAEGARTIVTRRDLEVARARCGPTFAQASPALSGETARPHRPWWRWWQKAS